jgi:hypothetical protein
MLPVEACTSLSFSTHYFIPTPDLTMIRNLLLASAMTLGLCTFAFADNVGKKLPVAEIEGLAQSPASSLDELSGRALLIEFFAYW